MAQLGVAYHEPFVPGPGMQFQATVTEQYEKKDKGWVKLRSRLTHQGRHVATVEMIGVWPL